MLNILDQEYYDKVLEFAKETNQLDKLQHELDYLDNYGIGEGESKDKTRCDLYKDFAPQSFYFILHMKQEVRYWECQDCKHRWVQKPTVVECTIPCPRCKSRFTTGESPKDDYVKWFNGGLIYHGKHDNGGDGSAPTFSVNLTPQYGWSIHT
jgi:hypothetical protein